jgi:hypothetical protein
MKTYGYASLALTVALLLSLQSLAQGPLEPSDTPDPKSGPLPALTAGGDPQANMKSLDQVEARTPIDSLPFTISIPGSYYVSAPLSTPGYTGILIECDHVALDLNGFTLSGASGYGIKLESASSESIRNVAVFNGGISGFYNGVFSVNASDCRIEELRVLDCANQGIELKSTIGVCGGNTIENCLCGGNEIVISSGAGASNQGNSIENCITWDEPYGIIIDASGSAAVCRGNTIRNCILKGHGIRVYAYTGTVEGNLIEDNLITQAAGSVYYLSNGGIIQDNLIVRNAALLGGYIADDLDDTQGPPIFQVPGTLNGDTANQAHPWANFYWSAP